MSDVPKAEKDAIRELLRQGYSTQEAKARFPHVNGQVISGLQAKLRFAAGAIEAPTDRPPEPVTIQPSASAPAPASVRAPFQAPTPVYIPPALISRPMDLGIKTPAMEASISNGFTPASASPHNPGGFISSFQHFYVVKKLDGGDAGVIRQERPPFTIQEFMSRYKAPGEYEIQEFREGRLFTTYKERIAPSASDPYRINSEERKPDGPVDSFFKAIEAVHKLHESESSKQAVARANEASAQASREHAAVAREQAKAQVETSATVGLIDLVKNATAPRADPVSPYLEKILLVMDRQSQESDARHKRDMEELRERQGHERDMERTRLKQEKDEADAKRKEEHDRWKDEMLQREKDRNMIFAKVSEIEKDRDKFHRESYDKMMGEVKETRDAIKEELDERRKYADEMITIQKQNAEEMIAMKKSLGDGAKDVEVAKIIEKGITGSIDRIGHRVDLLAQSGAFGGGAAHVPSNGSAKTNGKEGSKILTDDEAKQEVEKPWFRKLKGEVVATLNQRAKGLRLHGGMLGQVFVESLNSSQGVTMAHLHWLCSRTWPQVLEQSKDAIEADEMKLLSTPDGEKWFSEFQWFLAESYANSIPSGK